MNDETNTILETKTYTKFKFMGNNRELQPNHIAALKTDLQERGQLTPIVVNELMEVIDGQHRVVALTELGLPISYIVVPGLRIGDALAMNILQKGWSIDDYAHSYADSGNINYQRYLALKDEFGFSNSITLHAISVGDTVFKKFRQGELDLNENKLADATQRLTALESVMEWATMVATRPFAIAFFDILASPEYDQERMERKLATVGRSLLKALATPEDNRRMLEEIYNHGQGSNTRVRLYQ